MCVLASQGDPRRTNVALTRGRLATFVLGNIQTLTTYSVKDWMQDPYLRPPSDKHLLWFNLVKDAINRGMFSDTSQVSHVSCPPALVTIALCCGFLVYQSFVL